MTQIRERLGIPPATRCPQSLEDVVECKRTGEFYTGDWKVKAELGQVPLIDLKSIEAMMSIGLVVVPYSIKLLVLVLLKQLEDDGCMPSIEAKLCPVLSFSPI